MVHRYDVSEGADGLIRVGTAGHTHMKLTREDAAWLMNVLAERLGVPPPVVKPLPWWTRVREWFARKLRTRGAVDREAMYERIGKKLAERYGASE